MTFLSASLSIANVVVIFRVLRIEVEKNYPVIHEASVLLWGWFYEWVR